MTADRPRSHNRPETRTTMNATAEQYNAGIQALIDAYEMTRDEAVSVIAGFLARHQAHPLADGPDTMPFVRYHSLSAHDMSTPQGRKR